MPCLPTGETCPHVRRRQNRAGDRFDRFEPGNLCEHLSSEERIRVERIPGVVQEIQLQLRKCRPIRNNAPLTKPLDRMVGRLIDRVRVRRWRRLRPWQDNLVQIITGEIDCSPLHVGRLMPIQRQQDQRHQRHGLRGARAEDAKPEAARDSGVH